MFWIIRLSPIKLSDVGLRSRKGQGNEGEKSLHHSWVAFVKAVGSCAT